MPDDVMFVGGRGSCQPCQNGDHDLCDTTSGQPDILPCHCWAWANHGVRSLEDYEADMNQHHDSHLKGEGW